MRTKNATQPAVTRLLRYMRTMLMQPSTWRGAVMLTALGSAIAANPERAVQALKDPTSMETLIGLGLFVAGLIGALVPDAITDRAAESDEARSDGTR